MPSRTAQLGVPVMDRLAFLPIFARTATVQRPVTPIALDCIKLIFVRSGSAFLFSEFGE